VKIIKTEAIVLGSTELIGAHKIISLYSPEYGQIRGVAHGIKGRKSKFGSALEPLTHIHLIFKFRETRELQLIQHADTINSYEKGRQNITCLATGLYLAELIQKLTPVGGNGQNDLFQLILKTLYLLSEGFDIYSVISIFEIRLIDLIGYRPCLEKCISCSMQHTRHSLRWGFSPSMGGLICPSCRDTSNDLLPISTGGIMFLKQALRIHLDFIGRLKILPSCRKEMEMILHQTLLHYLPSPTKSYNVLLRILDNLKV
jgi:DNA repair protein RecO (recombination protein O)